jgi:hypothetical protein
MPVMNIPAVDLDLQRLRFFLYNDIFIKIQTTRLPYKRNVTIEIKKIAAS